MSSHDCRVSGVVQLRAEVTEAQLQQALAPFLKYCQTDTESAQERDDIELDGTTLHLSLEFTCMGGGYRNEDVDALVAALSSICEGPNYLEFEDFDTGDSDAKCAPLFIGTGEDARTARLNYGLAALETWALGVIGKEAFDQLAVQVLALPRKPLVE